MIVPAGDPRLASAADLSVAAEFVAAAGDEGGYRSEIEAFLAAHPDALLRTCLSGHLTASALVLDARGERLLLLRHRKLDRWLQPGGHADGDANLAGVAWREATEETGIAGLAVSVPAIDLDVHVIPESKVPQHLHLDVRFLVLAPRDAQVMGNEESTALRWVRFDELDAYSPDAGLRRLAAVGRRAWRAMG